MANGPADNHRWERLFLKVAEQEEVSGWVSQIFVPSTRPGPHTSNHMDLFQKNESYALQHGPHLLAMKRSSQYDRESDIYMGDAQSGMGDTETDRKTQSVDCTDNLTHHMPHWLSSCYQSVCISPTLHGLPVLVNMPHTQYPTAWKRVQRSIKNFLIP